MTIHLYTDQAIREESGVWAALLHCEETGKRKKWYGTLNRTSEAHLRIHAVQEGLNALRGQGRHVTVHAETVPCSCPDHTVTFSGIHVPLNTPLAPLIPPARSVPRGLHVPTDIRGLEITLALSALDGEFWLTQLRSKDAQPLLRLPAFTEGRGGAALAPEGFTVPRAHYRELLLQYRQSTRVLN
ncbi:hypothetical protein Deipr_2322 (plasmid) [Deinococcus proteolyticus MRP]|uniref:Uncharacterized protein n=1 Tax=Deinococcus proteolyticus (strain ATCC 35074 / DSM 20540 / JCM 6276 / NBRC 101906 / NCIMB 13154 / VKM Ac-1939 / CCM 2703 / MRP) TaxID=693977 RepID=F0RQ88_DEIPM|nr:hypothetical protein [Deinococcus proteolyticus]ADY27447.1 hypothetical protein Deipr_2322 [Deinococcus proteolyticus MRP]